MKPVEMLTIVVLSAMVGALAASLYKERGLSADVYNLTQAVDNLVNGVNVISEGLIMTEFGGDND